MNIMKYLLIFIKWIYSDILFWIPSEINPFLIKPKELSSGSLFAVMPSSIGQTTMIFSTSVFKFKLNFHPVTSFFWYENNHHQVESC